jgi:hypothetical protein
MLAAAIALLGLLTACGNGKHAEARAVMEDNTRVMQAYVDGLEQAGSAEDCAAAINTFTDEMVKLVPRIKALQEKYPDLFQPGSETPPELAEEHQRMVEVSDKMQAASMNMMKYMMDPQVQSAMQRMATEMQQMGS